MSLEQDTATIESLLRAVYDGISGKRPDWDRLTPLFHPDARLVPPARENNPVTAITFAQYIDRSMKIAASRAPDGWFYERGIAHIIQTYPAQCL